jgi:hypothetical protein
MLINFFMAYKKYLCSLFYLIFCSNAFAQKINEATVEYVNIKAPLIPLLAQIKNYQVILLAPYVEKNKELKALYENEVKKAKWEYDSSLKQYPKDVKAAEQKYADEMEEYKKKNLAEKIIEKRILLENNKPVKTLTYQPSLREVPKPVLQTEYNLTDLASTYIKLENYENNPADAVKIVITLYGYDYTQPRLMNIQRNVLNFGKSGTSSGMQTYYYSEYSYRHPMSYKVILPDGKELLNKIPQPLNSYKIAKSGESTTYFAINEELLVKTTEEKILQDNLTYINKELNDNFGFYKESRKAVLYKVKDKNDEYGDLTTAFNKANTGLIDLLSNEEDAKTALMSSAETWLKALGEVNLKDKKARIDEDIAIAICFNLLETYYALKNYTEGIAIIEKLNAFNMSNRQRMIKNQFQNDFIDLKKRMK